jgi:hypothetical protein
LYQSLYAQYSTLDFSYPADRSVALLGLEQRLARAFDDHGEHGIFKTPGRLERSLMWRRGLDGQGKQVKQLVRIKQKVTDHDRGRSSPTWSWMAYEGGIGFIKPRGGSLDWEPKPRGISWLTGDDKGNLRLRGLARDFELAVPNDMLNADIIWDAGDKPEKEILKCVVLGKDTDKEQLVVNLKKNYVLIIAKKVSASKEVLYERVGVGFLLGKFLKAGEEEDVFVV